MTLDFKSTYTYAIRERYFKSSKSQKSKILIEFCNKLSFSGKRDYKDQFEKNNGRLLSIKRFFISKERFSLTISIETIIEALSENTILVDDVILNAL